MKKTDIKTNLKLNYEDLGYTPNPPTDDEIYYYWGLKLIKGIRSKPTWASGRRDAMKGATREELIEYAKEFAPPLPPDEDEYIPRKYWAGLDDLVGEDLRILGHPIWNITQRIIRENWKPTSETLIVQACANNKPYAENITYLYTKQRHEEGYCDVVVNSVELVPLEFTYYYPFRYYDWSHLKESEFVTDALIRRNIQNIISFVREFQYKKIIVSGVPLPDTHYQIIYEALVEQYEGTDVEVHLLMDEETTRIGLEECAKGYWGLLKLGYYSYFPTRKRLDMLLGYDGLNPLPSDEAINKVREKRVASRLRSKEKPKFTGFRFGV